MQGRGSGRRKINSFPVISLVQTGRVERCQGSVEQLDGAHHKQTHGSQTHARFSIVCNEKPAISLLLKQKL